MTAERNLRENYVFLLGRTVGNPLNKDIKEFQRCNKDKKLPEGMKQLSFGYFYEDKLTGIEYYQKRIAYIAKDGGIMFTGFRIYITPTFRDIILRMVDGDIYKTALYRDWDKEVQELIDLTS